MLALRRPRGGRQLGGASRSSLHYVRLRPRAGHRRPGSSTSSIRDRRRERRRAWRSSPRESPRSRPTDGRRGDGGLRPRPGRGALQPRRARPRRGVRHRGLPQPRGLARRGPRLRGLPPAHGAPALSAIPDIHLEIHDVVAGDDLVAYRATLSGTHRGRAARHAAHRAVASRVQHMHMLRMRDGRACEHWATRDDLGMLQQLGIIPHAGAAGQPGRPSAQARPRSGVERARVVEGLHVVVAADRAVVDQDLGHGVAPVSSTRSSGPACRAAGSGPPRRARPSASGGSWRARSTSRRRWCRSGCGVCVTAKSVARGSRGAPGVRGACQD